MSEVPNFMALAVAGRILPFEIDDFVDEWHSEEGAQEIHEFLGMSFEEYSLWVSDPEAIDVIIAARHKRQPLYEAVNDNLRSAEKLAARSDEASKIAGLKRWIEAQPDR